MCYIWHLNIDGHVELHEDAIKLIPELAFLEPKLLKYVILYADYRKSPIKDFPAIQRDKIAKIKSGFSEFEDLLSQDFVKFAITEFTSLIYDDRRDLRNIFLEKLEKLKIDIRDPEISFKELKDKREMIRYFDDEIQKIDTQLNSENMDDDPDLKGNKTLSYLEKWQRRRKKFKLMMSTNG